MKTTFTICIQSKSREQEINCGQKTNLKEICEEQDSPILFGCGQGACGSCIVEVEADANSISAMESDEKDFLESMDALPGERLACCLTVSGDVKIHLR